MKKRICIFPVVGILAAIFLTACSSPLPDGPNSSADLLPQVPTQEGGYAMGMGLSENPGLDRGTLAPETLESRAVSSNAAGIDVSYYQGTINWTSVYNAGKRFAFVRASYGTGTIDTKFSANWAGAKAAGVVRGAYQFFRPSQDAAAQANVLLATMGTLAPGDLPPVIDVEVTEGVSYSTITTKVKTWVDIVKNATGKAPIIYTSPGFWNSMPNTASLSACTLWIAHWGVSSPKVPSPWTSWKFWQYSETGAVSGISGAVDLDYFNGDVTALKSFAGGSVTPVVEYEKPFTRYLMLTSPATTGSDVKLLQTLLNDWASSNGYATLTVDGSLGSLTSNMIKSFQTANGLLSDGIAGPATLKKLVSLFALRDTFYAPYTRALSVTSPLMNGSDVKTFQTAYNRWASSKGYTALSVDGYYGSASQNAATKFQGAESSLLGTPDGIAGKHTQRLLFIRSWQ